MGNVYGKNIQISIFGESHGVGIGVVIDGLEPGFEIDFEKVRIEMNRRRPGGNKFATKRNESDEVEILSGYFENRTTGTPLAAIIRNKDTRSNDYSEMKDIFRPSHGDYPGFIKYRGFNDVRGGGHFSARITAPLVFAGAVAKQMLEKRGVKILSHVVEAGGYRDKSFIEFGKDLKDVEIKGTYFPVIDESIEAGIIDTIENARLNSDSIGGIVEIGAVGINAGIGDPFFDSVESRLSQMVFSIPGVKGISFGKGFDICSMKGSQANDCYDIDDGRVVTTSNNNGGITGGITNGMPIVYKIAFKPTSSIAKEQDSVTKDNDKVKLSIRGRHDPTLFVRGVVVAEATCALVLLDLLHINQGGGTIARQVAQYNR